MNGTLGVREARKQETSRRIMLAAQELAEDRGFDGFTMEDLAEAAGVSRRTLFNYFPGKIDAILGPVPDFSEADLARFTDGGPEGRLVPDLLDLFAPVLTGETLGRDVVEVGRRVLLSNPRLLLAAHQRFEEVCDQVTGLILDREGEAFGIERARLLVRILVAVFDAALTTFTTPGEDRPLVEIFSVSIHAASELLA